MLPSPGTGVPLGNAGLAALAEIGRALLEAQLDEDQLCELVYKLAGDVVPVANFQLGLLDGDRYRIQVWVRDGEKQAPQSFAVPPDHGLIAWMRESRHQLLVRDFQVEMSRLPFKPTYESASPPRSAIYLPLVVGSSLMGLISIQSPVPNAFGEEELRVLAVLANQTASALNNARLYQRSQRRLMDLAAVAEVGRTITSILRLDELLGQVVTLIKERFDYYHVQIFLVPRGSDRAYFRASSGHGLNEKWQREGRYQRLGEAGIISWVAQHGEPLLANDVMQEPRYIPDDPRLLPGTRAELAVPLVVEGDVLGVLDIQSTQVNALNEDDLFVLRMLADQVAVAVNSARAYEAQREEAWLTTVLLQVAEATGQAEGFRDVLRAAVRVTAMLAGVDSAIIWLWDEELDCFEYGASFGLKLSGLGNAGGTDRSAECSGSGLPEDALRFLAREWPALDRLRIAKTSAVIGLDNVFLPRHIALVSPGDSLALLPLLGKGQVFGVMGVSFTHDVRAGVNERRLTLLGGIAHQVAAAVDGSRLAAAREEEAWVSTVLLQVAEAIGRFQPVEATLAQVAHLTPLLAGVDRCAVLLRNDIGDFVLRQVHAVRAGLKDAYEGAVIRPGELPLLDDACRIGQPLVVDDADRNPRVPRSWGERYGSRTLLVVPLLVADDVIGALLADDVDSTHKFSPRRVRILNGIASQAAVALENARLQAQETASVRLSHELELGRAIQRSLLPKRVPGLAGYQLVYRWRSAREVGGDFFDFIPLPAGKLGILVADVSGKGVPAALYMMFARTLLRSIAFSGRPPGAMLERTNELMLADSASDLFVTAFYTVLDTVQHTLAYASGGHNLALYVPAQGDAQTLMTDGLMLGVMAPVAIEEKTQRLAPGDVALFYTDGITDARSPSGDAFGDHRLATLLLEHRHGSAEAIADAIDGALKAYVGEGAQYDDLTLVLLKRDLA